MVEWTQGGARRRQAEASTEEFATREDAMTIRAAISALSCLALALAIATPAAAQTAEVKIGLIAPMSGPWARQGDLMLKGAQLALEDING
jgi:ABC-type branched-subunit amino acid transport system substrate-binding protein